jgi:SsrA-binding protein
VWLYNVHINSYSHRGYVDHDPKRRRKLLLHKQEIRKLIGKTVEKGLTLVPTRLYFKNGKVKVALALAKVNRRTTREKPSGGVRSSAKREPL